MQACCQSCGAPDNGEFVNCLYCRNPVSAQAVQYAVPCPSCRTACRWGKQQCGQCRSWLVVSCLFCGALSPHNCSNCMSCREAFVGARERIAARQQQISHQQNAEIASAVAPAAASFLGAMVGAMIDFD